MLWKPEERDGKLTKIPYSISGIKARVDAPSTWCSYDECYATYLSSDEYDGIGFVLTKDVGLVGIDLDGCRDPQTGEISDEADRIVSQLQSYTEISPSQSGLHIWIYGTLPVGRRRKGPVEMYDSGRFLTVTGNVHNGLGTIVHDQKAIDAVYKSVFGTDAVNAIGDTIVVKPTALVDDEELLEKAASAKNGAKFCKLYYNGAVADYPSESEADLALCAELAFWTHSDHERMDRLFRGSARYRPKWDEKHGSQTYGQMTITKACEGRGDVYCDTTDDESDCEQYFDGNRFVAKRVADDIVSRHHFFTFADTEEIYVYDASEGIYGPGGEQVIRDETQRLLGDRTTNHYVNEVEGYIRRSRYLKREELIESPDLIPVRNGVLDRRTRILTPYTPEKPFIAKIAAEYDQDANCPAFKEYLCETFHADDIPLIEEIIGDLLYRSYWHKKSVMLLGVGDNGKSVLLFVEGSFLGADNISTRGLQDLDRDRFAKADLFGKFANIHADISSTALAKTGAFKMLTGGDRIAAEKKYQHPFSFVNYAKLHFSANELPATKDQTPAFFDRWLLIEPPYRFVDNPLADNEKRRNPRLLEQLTTEKELSGILNMALDGLDRLLSHGTFTVSKASDAVRERWIARTDSLQAFVSKCVSVKKGCFVSKDAFYLAYQDFCEEHSLNAVEKGDVGKRLPTIITTAGFRPQADEGRPTAWKDISIAGVEEKCYGHTQATPDLRAYSAHVTHVKANLISTCRSADPSCEQEYSTKPEERCENTPDMPDASSNFVHVFILDGLRLRKATGLRVPTVDELMTHVVNDIHLDHNDLHPADIAAAFRDVQGSDEGRLLLNELVCEPNSADISLIETDGAVR